jgi:hypothetical protein
MSERQKAYCRTTAERARDRFARAVEHIERDEPATAADMLERVIAECKALRKSLKSMEVEK